MSNRSRALKDAACRSGLSSAVFTVILLVSLFLPAGDIWWTEGWVFVGVAHVLTVVSIVYLWRTNPEIFVARSKIHQGTKRWDLVFMTILLTSIWAEFPVAAFDSGRFHWSSVPLWGIVLGYVLLCVGYFVSVWAYRVNKFAEPGVRIQTDRGHQVIDTGPYAIVRHPVYVGGILLVAGIPLALGSLWALVPAGIGALTLLARIQFEERILCAELDGYTEYTRRVRYRLFPGIW
jgi:protein-S-isoprenylcysteine O-methyltransferase Ste14